MEEPIVALSIGSIEGGTVTFVREFAEPPETDRSG